MKRINHIKFPVLLLCVVIGFQACFNLDEEAFSLVDSDTYYKDKTSVEGIISDSFTGFCTLS